MLKVLWFTNVVLPEASLAMGLPQYLRAGWLEGYLEALRGSGDVSVTVATRSREVDRAVETVLDGVRHIVLPSRGADVTAPLTDALVSDYCGLVNSIAPDLIHYHGTECHYGLLSALGHVRAPSVLSVQGLLAECGKAYYGRMSFRELLKAHTLREICHRGGIFGGRRQFLRRSIMEQTMLRGMKHIIGRTLWDRAHIREIHPEAEYHHCDELLRPAFYGVIRSPDLFRRHSICVSTAFYPLKGLHVLLRAAALLTGEFPDLSIRIPDSRRIQTARTTGYSRYLQSMIRDLHLGDHMEWLDPLDDRGVADLLSDSHLFVNPSFMENSSNSLAEAMIVGVPAIASYAGGNPSMLRDRETGLLFPAGDHALLAEDIRLLFTQEGYADRLAANARVEALARHDCAGVGAALVGIYLSIAGGKSGFPAK